MINQISCYLASTFLLEIPDDPVFTAFLQMILIGVDFVILYLFIVGFENFGRQKVLWQLVGLWNLIEWAILGIEFQRAVFLLYVFEFLIYQPQCLAFRSMGICLGGVRKLMKTFVC